MPWYHCCVLDQHQHNTNTTFINAMSLHHLISSLHHTTIVQFWPQASSPPKKYSNESAYLLRIQLNVPQTCGQRCPNKHKHSCASRERQPNIGHNTPVAAKNIWTWRELKVTNRVLGLTVRMFSRELRELVWSQQLLRLRRFQLPA